jgi:hypothetical protein
MTFDGTLTITLDAGYNPLQGDSFSLFTLGGPITGQFDSMELPGLGSSLGWDISTLYVDGFLRVIPEPTSAISVLLTSLVLGVARRRGHGSDYCITGRHEVAFAAAAS